MNYTVKPRTVIDCDVDHKASLTNVVEEDRFVRFVFEIEDVPTRPMASGIFSKADLELGTPLCKWLSVLNGKPLGEGDNVNLESFIGRIVEVKLKKKEQDGVEFLNVVDIVKLASD